MQDCTGGLKVSIYLYSHNISAIRSMSPASHHSQSTVTHMARKFDMIQLRIHRFRRGLTGMYLGRRQVTETKT